MFAHKIQDRIFFTVSFKNLIMIKVIIFVLSIFYSINLISQNIDVNYYSTGAGRNVTLSSSKNIGNSELGLGLGYNIGSIKQPDDQSNIFYKRLYPTKPIHYFNFNAYYNYYFYNKWNCFKPLFFYDIQIKYSTTRSSMYIPFDYDSTLVVDEPEEGILYRKYIEYFGPYLWVENSIGLGFKVDITDRIYLKQKVGLGIHLIFGEDERLPGVSPEWEFYGLINIGLGIKLKNTNK